ncbi:hypothetical protein XAC2143 [Xanthomonas citri pv. citri str. 306]|uniref:Uncharacterized protein n=6 Tax=Xanthomonas TaxID=338 RepID=A0AAI7ZFG7_XANAC|nr:hypothetical protein XAC2143 [Xanthomonas citri pv. citri str. 306]
MPLWAGSASPAAARLRPVSPFGARWRPSVASPHRGSTSRKADRRSATCAGARLRHSLQRGLRSCKRFKVCCCHPGRSSLCSMRMSTTSPEDLLTMEGTLHGIAYAVVARQLERQRVVLDTLQVGGQSVPLLGSPTFGSLQAAVDIGSKLAEQYIGELLKKQTRPRSTSPNHVQG